MIIKVINMKMKYFTTVVIVVTITILTFVSISLLYNNNKDQKQINVLNDDKIAEMVTETGKIAGTFYVIKLQNHKYIIFESGNKFGMTHFPDCDCKISKFKD